PSGARNFATMSQSFSNSVILSKVEESRCVTFKLSPRDPSLRAGVAFFARDDISNPPERPMRAELCDFSRGLLADINGDADHAGKGPDKSGFTHPRWNVPVVQGVIQ